MTTAKTARKCWVRQSQNRRGLVYSPGVAAQPVLTRVFRPMRSRPLLCRLKDWARIALRRDKTRRSWMGFAHLAAAMINLRLAEFSHTS